jgi:hypothetical protein
VVAAPLSSFALPYPDGTVVGDLLIAIVGGQEDTSLSADPPAGWNVLRRKHAPGVGTQGFFNSYWRIAASATGTEWNTNLELPVGAMFAIGNPDPTTPIAAEDAVWQTTGATTTAPSVTPARSGLLISTFYRADGTGSITSRPAGMTTIDEKNNGTNTAAYKIGAYMQEVSSGATGTRAITYSTNNGRPSAAHSIVV